MKVIIIGGGQVGGYIASLLLENGNSVAVIVRGALTPERFGPADKAACARFIVAQAARVLARR